VDSAKLADGVYYLTGGTHHSLVVEMKDHIVLVDTPNDAPRALAVIAKTKELVPNKPIRYVVTSHHHWDHLGGIRSAIDEGATIVTHQTNKAFLERVAKTPHTLNPDRLSTSKKAVKIQTVGDMAKLTDGTRTIELYNLTGYEHTVDMLVVYLPKEKILAEADAFTPPATPTTPLAVSAVPYAAALYDNIQRRKLDVKTIAPFHGGRTTEVTEVARAAGKSPTVALYMPRGSRRSVRRCRSPTLSSTNRSPRQRAGGRSCGWMFLGRRRRFQARSRRHERHVICMCARLHRVGIVGLD
jgi:glyoxylase-like metal-dependent hydrolase (beta-lactamase superfamily II)